MEIKVYAIDFKHPEKNQVITTIPIRMTNKRYGLMRKSPTSHFKKLAKYLYAVAYNASIQYDAVHIAIVASNNFNPNRDSIVATFGPRVPDYTSQEFFAYLSTLSRRIVQACVIIYGPTFHATKTNKSYRYKNKGKKCYVNYGGIGRVTIDYRNKYISYTYEKFSTGNFSRSLLLKLMRQYIDWTHDIHICEVDDKNKEQLKKTLNNLYIDTRLGGGKVVVTTATFQALGLTNKEEDLPF